MHNFNVFLEILAALYVLCFIVAFSARLKWLSILFAFVSAYYFLRSMRAERSDQAYYQHLQEKTEDGDPDTSKKGDQGED